MVMVLAMAAPSFAAEETGSITIENATQESAGNYKAYKIFDVVYNNDKTAYAYTIEKTSPWHDIVEAYEGITLIAVPGNDAIENVEINDNFNASEFSATLRNAAKDVEDNGFSFEFKNNAVICDNLDLGYYFVNSTTGTLCNLTTTNPAVEIKDKNDVPFEKTADTEENGSVEVGQEITYTVAGKVPDTTGFSEYDYIIRDEMSDGLTFNADSIKITIGSQEFEENEDGFTFTAENNGFTLSIPVINLQDDKDEDIIVTYTATVNDKAVTVISENEATLTYGNDSNIGTRTEIVKNYTSKLVIDKFQKNQKDKKLADATFVLYKEEKNEEEKIVKKYYKYADGEGVKWVDNQEEATSKTTDAEGKAEFIGLADGTYYLLETEAPAGYNLLPSAQEVEIDGAGSLGDDVEDVTVFLIETAEVANSTGTTLPSTGGIGTTMFYAVGIVLMAGAVFFVVRRKRA